MKAIFTGDRITIGIFTVFFILLLFVGYEYFISESLLPHLDYEIEILVLFVLLALIPVVFIPINSSRPSTFVKWVLYLLVIIPAVIFPYLTVKYHETSFFIFNCVLIFSFYILCKFTNLRLFRFSKLQLSSGAFYVIFFSVYAFFALNLIRTFGFSLSLVSLRDVYSVRDEFKSGLEAAGVSSSQIRWLLFVFNPFLIASGFLDKKKLWMLVIGLFGEVLIYSISGLKSALAIGPVLIILIIGLNRLKSYENLGKLVLKGIIALVLMTFLVDLVFFSEDRLYMNIASSLVVRRNFLMPGYLTGLYFSFFDSHGLNFMANNSILGYLVDYSDIYNQMSPPRVIGGNIFGNYDANVNANIWADGFAQYGYFGVFFVSVFLGFFLHCYDSIAQYVDKRLAIIMIVPFCFALCNSAFITVMLGHGAILCFVILYMYSSTVRK